MRMKKMDEKVSKKTKVLSSIKYMNRIIWEHDRKYLLYMMLEILLKPVRSVWTVMLPMMIVENLTGHDLPGAIRFAAVFLTGELVIKSALDYLNYRSHVCEDNFDYFFYEEFCDICMDMPYEITENSEKLDQIQDAKDGLDWSGRVACAVDAVKEITAAVISLLSVFSIIFKDTPFLILPVIFVVIMESHFQKKEMEENRHYYGVLTGLNRKTDYYLHETSSYEYGKDIRLYGAKALLLDRAQRVINENAEEMKKTAKRTADIRALSLIMETVCDVLQYLYVGIYTLRNHIPIARFTMLISSTAVMTSSVETIFREYNNMMEGTEYFYRYWFFTQNPEYKEGTRIKAGIPEKKEKHVIELKNLCFSYPGTDRPILKNINLSIRPGEKLSIVGQNGQGKTTLIKLICGLYRPSSGRILLDGVDIWEYDPREYRKLLAPVFQDFRLFAATIEDNIVLDGTADAEKLNAKLKKYGMYDKIGNLGAGIKNELLKEFDEEGYQPSGGEGQKLALARADYRDAPFILLDEPTAALDPEAEYSLYQDVRKNMEDKTILFISHRLSSCKFCDRIIVLSEGKIAEEGTHGELMKKKGMYSRLFEAQAENYCFSADSREA